MTVHQHVLLQVGRIRSRVTMSWSSNAQCSFAVEPSNSYVWDLACSGGGLGCNADGQHQECRWCGFATYRPCSSTATEPPDPVSSPPTPAPTGVPVLPGCYIKQPMASSKCGGPLKDWTADTWGRDNANSWATQEDCLGRKLGHDAYCATETTWYFVSPAPTTEPAPTPAPPVPSPIPAPSPEDLPVSPGCYLQQPMTSSICGGPYMSWIADSWGKDHANSWASEQDCLGRKSGHDAHCGTETVWHYVAPPLTPSPTVAPPAPAPIGRQLNWQPSGQTVGSGWCRGEVPVHGWDLRKVCSGSTEVRVLSYNLFWWNLFGQRGGNGGSAGKLIKASGQFDIMGFQECEDVKRVLRDAGMEHTHTPIVAGHATAVAYRKDTWEELATGETDVAEDNRFQYYGRRGVGWARLRHRTNGKTVFVVNHHGPLQVNTGGKCGGEATAYNMLKVIGLHAQASDAKVLLGDLNADSASATQRVLKSHMYQASSHWVDAIFSSCESISSQNLGTGGSDHSAITAVFRI